MVRRTRRFAVLATVIAVAAACGSGETETQPAVPAADADETAGEADADEPAPEPETAGEDADLRVADTPLGEHLVDGEGITLYLFAADPAGESVCTDACLQTWPALTVDGDPVVGAGVDAGLVGTIEHGDGVLQLTYRDAPLYRFIGDTGPGDVEGQGVNDAWFVVAVDGTAITTDSEAPGGYGY